jgi:phosphate uptake regulator
MRRKIVQHGNSTLTLSLPFRWIKAQKLKKGDELEVAEMGKNLLVKVDHRPERATASLHFKKGDVFMKRSILNLYHDGYDEIRLDFEEAVPVSEILNKIEELLGFEIVEQSEHRCVIRNVANVLPEEFEPMLRRVFMVAISFSSDILAAARSGRYEPLSAGAKIERETNKLVNYCQRALNKGSFGISDILRHHMLTERLEVIGDALGDYAQYLYSNKPIIGPQILRFHEGINNYFRMISSEYFRASKDADKEAGKEVGKESGKNLAAARELRFKLYSDFDSLLKEKKTDTASVCYLKQMLEELHHIEIIV